MTGLFAVLLTTMLDTTYHLQKLPAHVHAHKILHIAKFSHKIRHSLLLYCMWARSRPHRDTL